MPRRAAKSWEVSFEARDAWRERQETTERRRPAGPPCPGPCNARYRRQQEALEAYAAQVEAWQENPVGSPPAEPEVGELHPWAGDPVLCPRCQSQARMELAELSDLGAILDAENSGLRHGPGSDRVSGSRHAPSPSPAADDLDELCHALRGWQSVAMGEGDIPPRTGFLMTELDTLTKRLSSIYFTRLVANADVAGDFAREIRQWHRRLTGQAKAGTGVHQKAVPCPRCGRYSLSWRDGDRHVACRNPDCARMLSLEEYDAYEEAYRGGARPVDAA